MNCIYCNNKKLYQLSITQVKCSYCKKKFSIEKIERKKLIKSCFENNLNASQCAKKLDLNYVTVSNEYKKIRLHIIKKLQNDFEKSIQMGYEEYIYVEKSKRKSNELYKAKNIITFEYSNGKVYNLLMPNLDRYQNLDSKELKRFLGLHKLQSTNETQNTIHRFWQYFEEQIVQYKGIHEDNFFEYLKEFEWKFNYLLID